MHFSVVAKTELATFVASPDNQIARSVLKLNDTAIFDSKHVFAADWLLWCSRDLNTILLEL